MTTMQEIHTFLSRIPGLSEAVTMDKAMSFLKDEIIVAQEADYDPANPPPKIPEYVRSFLGCATEMPDEFVSGCWTAFQDTIWTYDESGESTDIAARTLSKSAKAGSSGKAL
ncbi:hypothetical protein R3P38DRAFT_3401050 [Favolaschia claudopus]|uniref:Uncharacterized protein n=1 Tax=Favolaschia claudopus TaxID=2862362 RepID=A0AAW0ANP7_9AGAR